MKTVFHTRSDGRFIEIKCNLKKNKLQRTNQSSYFLEGSCSHKFIVKSWIQFRRGKQSQFLKGCFFIKDSPIHPYIDVIKVIWIIKSNWLDFPSMNVNKPFPVRPWVSPGSDSSSVANSGCCHKSKPWLHFK